MRTALCLERKRAPSCLCPKQMKSEGFTICGVARGSFLTAPVAGSFDVIIGEGGTSRISFPAGTKTRFR